MDTFLIVIFIVISFIISFGWYGIRRICPSCNRWNGLQIIKSEHQRTETRYKTKTITEVQKDEYGRVTGSTEKPVQIAVPVNFYTVTFECSHCHHKTQRILRNGKYLKESGIILLVCLALVYSAFNNKEVDKPNQNSNEIVPVSTSYDSNQNEREISGSSENYSEPKVPESKKADVKVEITKNENSIPDNEIVVEKTSVIITKDSPEDLKIQLAKDLLNQGLSIKIIADSSFLSRAKIRKLKRTLE
jgi:ribosomal protein L44E